MTLAWASWGHSLSCRANWNVALMPIDTYSLCPCGTGKKVKFCCPDLLGELQRIDRMLEGEQTLACLEHIERLQRRDPERACLLAIKGLLLRATGRWEDARANAATFADKHPDNPTALAELTIVTAGEQDGSAVMGTLQRALAVADGAIQSRLYEAIGVVARVLLSEQQWLAARGLLQLQTAIDREDGQPVQMLVELNRSANVPLLLKDIRPLPSCPDDVPWKPRFEEAMVPAKTGKWQAAAEKLALLAQEVGTSPVIWRTLATFRGWLADTPGCIEALQKLAALDVPLDDAVEAEAVAMLLADSPLGDSLEIKSLLWTVSDVELVEAVLTSESRTLEVSFDRSSLGSEDDPPPRAAYELLDRPVPETAVDLTLETVPRMLGQAMLYGRQTDREARLEVVGVMPGDLEEVKRLLEEIAGGALGSEAVEEEGMGQMSASEQLLYRRWRAPKDLTPPQAETLSAQHTRDALLNRWPQLALGILDGKSPREVAGEESWRLKLLAAVMVLQSWYESEAGEFDFNELRTQLGLPVLEPIDPNEIEIDGLAPVRLSRVMVEKASDEALRVGYSRTLAFGAVEASKKFARAIVDRPSLAGSELQLLAYSGLAHMERDLQRALRYVEQGRDAAESAGLSSGSWDLMELTIRFARGEIDQIQRLVGHIEEHHIEEPGVAERLADFLMGIGVLRPDGTPVPPPAGAPPPEAPGAEAEAPSSSLWTPDSGQPGGEKKIWIPD